VLRYCGPCWPTAQAELEERQHAEQEEARKTHLAWLDIWRRDRDAAPAAPPPQPGWSSSSRSWHDVRQFLTLIAQQPKEAPAATPEQLAEIAVELRSAAREMDGPIPADVGEFIARHLSPSA
jgi:hypothetical protein